VTHEFVEAKEELLAVELPYDKRRLYDDLSNMYYGDIFSNSPKSEVDRLKQRKERLRIQRQMSSRQNIQLLRFSEQDV
jgi:hypothetical protein